MNSSAYVRFDRVWKRFQLGERHDSLRDLIPAIARRLVGRSQPVTELRAGDFWAIRDLSFDVQPGQTMGIIGPNGSGKSTTLRMLTKILGPTRGKAEVVGRMGALIEVSAGFHGDLTGRENVYLQGAIMGMKAREIAQKFDEIVAFSGIEEFIDTPVKRYSSGMNARLGFSIAAHLEPDVLIVDEVLAVGDMQFQEQAYGRIRDLARSGRPVVIVSHQLDRVAELCTDAIFLARGRMVFQGTAEATIDAYVRHSESSRGTEEAPPTSTVEFTDLHIEDPGPVASGDPFHIRVSGRVLEPLTDDDEPLFIAVRSLQTGRVIYYTDSRSLGARHTSVGPFVANLSLQANLPPGNYTVLVTARDKKNYRIRASAPPALLRVIETGTFHGSVQLNSRLTVAQPA